MVRSVAVTDVERLYKQWDDRQTFQGVLDFAVLHFGDDDVVALTGTIHRNGAL